MIRSTLLAAAALLTLTAIASAAPVPAKAKPGAVKPASLICPVTKEKIASVKDASGSSTYKGKTYYFCCAGCKPMFDKDPAKYAKPAAK